jgi:GT2 family glycosyltransferase
MSSSVGRLLKTASKLCLRIRVVLRVHNCGSKTNTYPDNHRFFHETRATFLNKQNPWFFDSGLFFKYPGWAVLCFWIVCQIPRTLAVYWFWFFPRYPESAVIKKIKEPPNTVELPSVWLTWRSNLRHVQITE